MSDSAEKKTGARLFQGAKSRVYLALVLLVIIAGAIGLVIHLHFKEAAEVGTAVVTGGPGITSIPGAGKPSAAYTKAQTTANIEGERKAREKATAFIPTISRPEFSGTPEQFGQPATGDQLQCPAKKVVVMFKPNPESCTAANLQLARKTGVTAEELICQGCSCPALKLAGYTIGDFKRVGYTATQMRQCGFSLNQLAAAGYSAAALKKAGFSAKQLAAAGFTPGELSAAGYSPAAIDAAGYTPAQLAKADLANSIFCSPAEIKKLKAAGKTAAYFRQQGCGLAALKAAGFSAAQLKNAGYSAAALKQAGFSAAALKKAGFSAAALKNAGFSATALKDAGFSNQALKSAGFSAAQIKAADLAATQCNVNKLKKEREAGVSATKLRQEGCGLAALKAAGFSAAALKSAGFSASALKNAGFSANQLKNAGFSAAALKAAGYSAAQLKRAGFSAAALKNAGFSAAALKNAGFSASALKNAGFSAAALKDAGYSASALKKAGFSAAQLKHAGFSAGQLVSAGYGAKALRAAGFSASALRKAGLSASALRAAGFSANALRKAGFTNGDLLRAGFSPKEAGYHEPTTTTAVTQPAPTVEKIPAITADSADAKLARFEKQEHEDMSKQERADAIQRLEAGMMNQAQTFMTGWSNKVRQQLVKAPPPVPSAGPGEGAAAPGGGPLTPGGKIATGPVVKAGTILFAVLDTSINSDERTPIMAHIVAGRFKGSKLLGTFERRNTKLLIRFNLMNDVHYPKSISLDAVAIDPNTARTALSGQVNHHYLLRYGTLFASSFLEGISDAIMTQGVPSSNCVFGCTVNASPLHTDQQIAVGLGKVGEAYAQHMGQSFNRSPTVRVGAGTGLGVLIMSDLTLPAITTTKTSSNSING